MDSCGIWDDPADAGLDGNLTVSGWIPSGSGMDSFGIWMDPLAGMDETLAGWMVPLMRDWMIAFGRDEIPAEFGMVPLGRGFWIKNYG